MLGQVSSGYFMIRRVSTCYICIGQVMSGYFTFFMLFRVSTRFYG